MEIWQGVHSEQQDSRDSNSEEGSVSRAAWVTLTDSKAESKAVSVLYAFGGMYKTYIYLLDEC